MLWIGFRWSNVVQPLGRVSVLRINSERGTEALRGAQRIACGRQMIACLNVLANDLLPQNLTHGDEFGVSRHELLSPDHGLKGILSLARQLQVLSGFECFFRRFFVFF